MAIPNAPPAPPDTRTPEQRVDDYKNTAPPPPPSGKKITEGRWVGNQWVDWAVVPDLPDYPYGPVQVKPEAPPAPPQAPNTPGSTQAPVEERGGGGGLAPAPPAPPATTVSDTYRQIINQMLGMSGPSYSSQNYTAPVRPTSTLTAPTPQTVTGEKINLPAKSEFDQLVHDQIVKMLGGPSAEEAGKAAANSIPVSAYRNAILRELGVQQAGGAEQSGLTGTQGSGGFAGQTEARRQAAGESTAQFTGQYVDKAMADRRAEIERAMQMAQQQGQFEDAQALQAELARIDNQLRAQANANQLFNTQSSLYLGQLGNEEDRYKSDLSLYGTQVNADLQREQNANQRYATEVQKLLGMSDTELRRYLGELQNNTNIYGINVTGGVNMSELIEKARQFDVNNALNGGK